LHSAPTRRSSDLRQDRVADDDAVPPGVEPDLVDMRAGDEVAAMNAHETRVRPAFLEGAQRHAQQVAAVAGVQARVVTLSADVADLAAPDEPGDAAELHRDRLVFGTGGGWPRLGHGLDGPAYRLEQSLATVRLHDVVDRVQVERGDGVVVVGRDEHDCRSAPELRQNTREVESGQPRHPDVEEHGVDVLALQQAQGRGSVARGEHLADPVVLLEQERELGQRRWLVVNRQDREHGVRLVEVQGTGQSAWSTPTVTLRWSVQAICCSAARDSRPGLSTTRRSPSTTNRTDGGTSVRRPTSCSWVVGPAASASTSSCGPAESRSGLTAG